MRYYSKRELAFTMGVTQSYFDSLYAVPSIRELFVKFPKDRNKYLPESKLSEFKEFVKKILKTKYIGCESYNNCLKWCGIESPQPVKKILMEDITDNCFLVEAKEAICPISAKRKVDGYNVIAEYRGRQLTAYGNTEINAFERACKYLKYGIPN